MALSGCSDIEESRTGQLVISPGQVTFDRLDPEEEAVEEFTLRNADDADPVTVQSMEMRPRSDEVTDEDLELLDPPSEEFELEPEEERTFEVRYTERGQRNAAIIDVEANDSSETREVEVETVANSPELEARPNPVRFPRLEPGQGASDKMTVTVRNYGSVPLTIHDVSYSGGNAFSVDGLDEEEDEPVSIEPYDSADAEEDPESYEYEFEVNYAPEEEGEDEGELKLISNDTSQETNDDGLGVSRVDVLANADSPCILVDGTTRRFGQVPIDREQVDVVEITNCGSETLEIDGIELTENSDDDEFALDLGSWDSNGDGEIDQPVELEGSDDGAGDSATFNIEYGPTEEGADSGEVVITSNDPSQGELPLELVGRGSDGECPEAEALARVKGEGSAGRPSISAAPLDTIILDGTGSEDPDGRVEDGSWRFVELPDDADEPSINDAEEDPDDPLLKEFKPLTAGTYVAELTVVDNEGFESCDPAQVEITVIPNETVHVELTWTNPEDPDETDDTGSDVDLHLAKMGPGAWFEEPYDIYYQNPENDWNPESPSLDIDDRDGAGPENIQMDDPANCEWYAVGVHYFRQRYGTAYATIRIYINENLVFESLNTPLKNGDNFWDVARIHWNDGNFQIYEVGDVMPVRPAGEEPEVTDEMEESDLCTAQDLY
ncbi:MAG: choice-of-anchor D domain-containing protein [Persicimonas sp.]